MKPYDDLEDDDGDEWTLLEDDDPVDLVEWAASMIRDGFIPMTMPARVQ